MTLNLPLPLLTAPLVELFIYEEYKLTYLTYGGLAMEKNKHILALFSSCQKELHHNNKNTHRSLNHNIINGVEFPVLVSVIRR